MVEEVVENESESEGGSDSRTSGDGKGNHLGKGQGEKEFREVPSEACEGANGVMVGMGQSEESEMVIEKLEDASENDSVGEQGTTI
ncbi:hypothetical protein Bca52824_004846 [Brassica carinata]|uniref:Uncharacterized protein n=1 Tax=Brassica carinata TaxID=52824 RepID=A0A8X7WQ86_BRACI|nr:hypothetical protein Bca52824_004846 [Brassica carinata]